MDFPLKLRSRQYFDKRVLIDFKFDFYREDLHIELYKHYIQYGLSPNNISSNTGIEYVLKFNAAICKFNSSTFYTSFNIGLRCSPKPPLFILTISFSTQQTQSKMSLFGINL